MEEEKKLQAYKKTEKNMQHLLLKKKLELQKLKEYVEIVCMNTENLTARLEFELGRKLGKFWFLTVFMSVALMFHAYANTSLLLTILNGAGFLFNWRSLYIPKNHFNMWYPTAFAWACIAFTLKAV